MGAAPAEITPRTIPLPIQREVRQRCGFGCVICGFPLYEYDHLLGWADVQRHVAAEITLLCDRHHREKTSGLVPMEAVRRANDEPHNLQQGVSRPYDLSYGGDSCTVEVGSNVFVAREMREGAILIPIVIDGQVLVGFVFLDGHLLLNLMVFDETNMPVMAIENNALAYTTTPWDIEFVGRRLLIRNAPRRFLFDIQFDPPNAVTISRGRFLFNGVELLIRPDHLLIVNNTFLYRGTHFEGAAAGIVIGNRDLSVPTMMRIQGVNRYLGDSSHAVRWAEEQMAQVDEYLASIPAQDRMHEEWSPEPSPPQ